MKLYYHKTDGGAEYLCSNYIICEGGHREGIFNSRYVVRIDGNIRIDAELTVNKERPISKRETIKNQTNEKSESKSSPQRRRKKSARTSR